MRGLGRIKLAFESCRMARLHRKHRAQHREAYKTLDNIVEGYRATGGLRHQYQRYKLFCLKELLEHEVPRSILELGSGTSTAVFANYVRGHEATLTTVDESGEWLESSRALAEIEPNDRRFRLLRKPKTVNRCGEHLFIGYGLDPKEAFDLVFVDGPSLRLDGQKRKDAVNDDVLRIIRTNPPRMIVVDGRAATVRALLDASRTLYTCSPSDIMKGGCRENYNYFSVFRAADVYERARCEF